MFSYECFLRLFIWEKKPIRKMKKLRETLIIRRNKMQKQTNKQDIETKPPTYLTEIIIFEEREKRKKKRKKKRMRDFLYT